MAEHVKFDFTDMGVAHERFQDALQECVRIQAEVDRSRTDIQGAYQNDDKDSAANAYLFHLGKWQEKFDEVKQALAGMTLELASTRTDYQHIEDLNQEINNAIASQLVD
jgi:hypothetical protein